MQITALALYSSAFSFRLARVTCTAVTRATAPTCSTTQLCSALWAPALCSWYVPQLVCCRIVQRLPRCSLFVPWISGDRQESSQQVAGVAESILH